MEFEDTPPVAEFESRRNEALTKLLDLDENTDEKPSDSGRFDIPKDADDRLKNYVKAEVAYNHAKAQAARPAFDTQSSSDEMLFQNADNFLTEGKFGRDSLERVFKRLYRATRKKESDLAFGPKGKSDNDETRRLYTYYLTVKVMIVDFADKYLGPGAGRKFSKGAYVDTDFM